MTVMHFTVQYNQFTNDADSEIVGTGDDVALVGKVVFTPMTEDHKPFLAQNFSPSPSGYLLRPVTGYLDTDGRLKTARGGALGVRLPANDPVFNVPAIVYRVTFENITTPFGTPVKLTGGYFRAPVEDTIVQLTNVLTPPRSSLTGNVPDVIYAADIADSGTSGRTLLRSQTRSDTWTALGKVPSTSLGAAGQDQNLVFPRVGLYTWYELTALPAETQWLGLNHVRVGGFITDAWMKYFANNGLDVLWAMGFPGSGYATPAALSTAVNAWITTYLGAWGPRGTYWAANPTVPYNPITSIQIGNEPNFFWPYTTTANLDVRAAHYAEVLVKAFDLIKANWPEVLVVAFSAGDSSAAGPGWIRKVLTALQNLNRLDAFDVSSAQTYAHKPFDQTITEAWGTWSGVESIGWHRQALKDFGVSDRPIWITETGFRVTQADGGFYTDSAASYDGTPGNFSQSKVAAYVMRTALACARAGVDRVYFMHTCDTDGYNGGWFQTDAGTLATALAANSTSTAAPRKTATAMRQLNALARDATKIEVLLDGQSSAATAPFAYRFQTPRGLVTVAWCQTPGTFTIPVNPDITQRVTDHLGTTITTIGGQSTYTARLTEEPMLIFPEPGRKKIVKAVANASYVLPAAADTDFTTYLGVGSAAVMPTAVGNTAFYSFVNTDSAAHDVFTEVQTTALLHGDGTNNSTVITDSSALLSNWDALGAAKLSTAQKKFGTASIDINVAQTDNRSNGTGSAIKASADASYFGFGTGDFTVEFHVRFNAIVTGQTGLADFRPGGVNGNSIVIFLEQDGKIRFGNQGTLRILASSTVSTGTWYHVALARSAGTTRLFIDGVVEGAPYTDSTNYLAAQPYFGATSDRKIQMSGWLDNIRITKGQALYTAGFTPPSSQLSASNTSVSVAGGSRTDLISTGTSWISL